MSKPEPKPSQKAALANFIMKICSIERYIEIKRQMLCDRTDFEPYVAYQRLSRHAGSSINASSIQQFLAENLIEQSTLRCQKLVDHYDLDKDTELSYKEFLDVVLPKEHPELRAFVTQRECYDIKNEEYFSYETEAAMAILFGLEISLFEQGHMLRSQLEKEGLQGASIIRLVDKVENDNLNFNNIQGFLNDSGLMPYDSEIISFLRRVDRDDDGVINCKELDEFLTAMWSTEVKAPDLSVHPDLKLFKRLRCYSPTNRKIVAGNVNMIPLDERTRKVIKISAGDGAGYPVEILRPNKQRDSYLKSNFADRRKSSMTNESKLSRNSNTPSKRQFVDGNQRNSKKSEVSGTGTAGSIFEQRRGSREPPAAKRESFDMYAARSQAHNLQKLQKINNGKMAAGSMIGGCVDSARVIEEDKTGNDARAYYKMGGMSSRRSSVNDDSGKDLGATGVFRHASGASNTLDDNSGPNMAPRMSKAKKKNYDTFGVNPSTHQTQGSSARGSLVGGGAGQFLKQNGGVVLGDLTDMVRTQENVDLAARGRIVVGAQGGGFWNDPEYPVTLGNGGGYSNFGLNGQNNHFLKENMIGNSEGENRQSSTKKYGGEPVCIPKYVIRGDSNRKNKKTQKIQKTIIRQQKDENRPIDLPPAPKQHNKIIPAPNQPFKDHQFDERSKQRKDPTRPRSSVKQQYNGTRDASRPLQGSNSPEKLPKTRLKPNKEPTQSNRPRFKQTASPETVLAQANTRYILSRRVPSGASKLDTSGEVRRSQMAMDRSLDRLRRARMRKEADEHHVVRMSATAAMGGARKPKRFKGGYETLKVDSSGNLGSIASNYLEQKIKTHHQHQTLGGQTPTGGRSRDGSAKLIRAMKNSPGKFRDSGAKKIKNIKNAQNLNSGQQSEFERGPYTSGGGKQVSSIYHSRPGYGYHHQDANETLHSTQQNLQARFQQEENQIAAQSQKPPQNLPQQIFGSRRGTLTSTIDNCNSGTVQDDSLYIINRRTIQEMSSTLPSGGASYVDPTSSKARKKRRSTAKKSKRSSPRVSQKTNKTKASSKKRKRSPPKKRSPTKRGSPHCKSKRSRSRRMARSANSTTKKIKKRSAAAANYFRSETQQEKKRHQKRPSGMRKHGRKQESVQGPSEETELFSGYLAELIFDEKTLEESRRRLASYHNFNAQEVFQMIDKQGKGRFTFEEFRSFLNEIGVSYADTRCIVDLYSSFDSHENCLLGFEDLVEMISPYDQSYLNMLFKDDLGLRNHLSNQLALENLDLLREFFNCLLDSKKLFREARMSFKNQGVDFHQIFQAIDQEGKGYLSKNDFEGYVRVFVGDFTESSCEELDIFMKKCDLDADGRISFKDFYMYFSL